MDGKTNRREHLYFWLRTGIVPLTVAGCSLLEDSEILAGTNEELFDKKYKIVDFNDESVFVGMNENKEIYALNLTCTHKQCTVEFHEDKELFICPCHKGKYEKNGKVIPGGKPKKDLSPMKLKFSGDNVYIVR